MEYTYSSYQVPATTQLPYVIWQLLTEVLKGGTARTNAWNKLKNYFEVIAKLIAEQFFGVTLTSGNVYSVYVCVTRHLACAFLSQNAEKVYFCNMQLVDINQPTGKSAPPQPLDGVPVTGTIYPAPNEFPSESTESDATLSWTPSLEIRDVRIWKLTTADAHKMKVSRTGNVIGVHPTGLASNKTFPLLGLTEKKLIVPPCSFFVEGMHVDVFEYPYVFLQAYKPETYTVNENWYTNFTNEYKFKNKNHVFLYISK